MASLVNPLRVTQGDDRTFLFTFYDDDGVTRTNLTGHVFTSHVRGDYADVSPSAVLSCALLDQSQPATKGQITATIDNAASAVMKAAEYYWDLQSTYSGLVTTWLSGKFIVDPEVTK